MVIAFLLSLVVGLQQTPSISPWPYQHVDKRAQISNSAITAIYMDRYEYVWFGSWDGLNRYDGSSIKTYKPDPFREGTISNNVVRNFLEDGRHNLWIVTHKGINRYNRDQDNFSNYLDSLNDLPFLEYNLRACIGPDSAVWVSLLGKGISKYAYERDRFEPITFENVDEQWLKSVIALFQSNGLMYLLGQDGKLICTLGNKMIFSKQLYEGKNTRLHQFVNLDGQAYLGLGRDNGELQLYQLSEIESRPLIFNAQGFPVSSLSENLMGNALWVGTEAGDIFKLHVEQGQLRVEPMNAHFPQFSKARLKILDITETRQDILWIGTDGDGVYKFLTRPKPFNTILNGLPDNGQLSHRIVRSVYEDADQTLLVGTRGGGLNIIKSGQEKAKILNTQSGLSNNAVLSVNKDRKGNTWVGVDGEGIDMIEAGTGRIFHFPRDFENRPNLNFGNVYTTCIDAFNDIWLGTSGYGVVRMKVSKSKRGTYILENFKQISNALQGDSAISIRSNVVYTIVEEKPNILWFGTRGGGIYRFNALTNKIEAHLHTGSPEKNRLSNDDVLSLHMDNQEQLWIGTSGGLNRLYLSVKPYRIEHYTQYDGLPNNTIHGILEDQNQNIWLSTNNGLVFFNRLKAAFRSFDANDGLQNNEFTDGAAFRSGNSERLYFGGINGLDVIYPSKIDTVNYFPRLTISQFQVYNLMISPGDDSRILEKHIDLTDKIKLAYNQNFISFHFTTLNYWNKQRTEYSYFLEKFDKDWNFIGQQSSVNLTNIPPGDYTLYINHTNENGVWNTQPKTIQITVTPPFWRTYWAYAFYFLLLVGLQLGIIFYIRWLARSKKAAAINNFKLQQMKELNDYKLQFFTNVAHEFRTPLTLILGPVSSLLKKTENLWEKSQLKTVYNNSLRLQKLIEELIQFRKIESGKDSLEIFNIDLLPFTQQIVESFQQYASERELHLEFLPEPESLNAWVDTRKLEKILINLISNAIKYNTKGGLVHVILKEEKGKAIYIIKDTGIGIDTDLREKIFETFFHSPIQSEDTKGFSKSTGIGLSLTKSLVQIHQGEINMESHVGKGTTFTVSLPISADKYTQWIHKEPINPPISNIVEKISLEFSSAHAEEHTEQDHEHVAKSDFTLLLVDDNAEIIKLLQNILSDKYHLLTAKNGRRALEILEHEPIDLVISDILMPDIDGITLCKNIKENIQTSHIPVILLTAKAEIEDRIEGLQSGADSYIPKPFHAEHLFIRIEKLIGAREQMKKRFENLADVELASISTGIGERDDEFLMKITQCIQNHLSEPEFNADTISEEVGMSKASLYKKVKAVTGLTPHGLIKQYRLKKAADLLRNSNMSVSEVIYETGFNSRSYFYKSFNEMFNCHPKDFS